MKIQTEASVRSEAKPVPGKGVDFVTDDGRTMFCVTIGSDGRSLEIRSPDICKVDGVLYGSGLLVKPNVSNSITIRTEVYE